MKYLLMPVFVLAFLFITINRQPVDFQPPSLYRAIKKINNTSDFRMVEDSVFNSKHKNIIDGKVYIIIQSQTLQIVKFAWVGRVETCRAGGCDAPAPGGFSGSAEYFDYFILFDAQKTVRLVKIFNYQATHGYEVSAKGWLKQFIGYESMKPVRVGHDIDAISGATISVYQLVADIEQITRLLTDFSFKENKAGR